MSTPSVPGGIAIVRSQFTDRVDKSNPVGDASTLVAVPKVIYWMDLSNPRDPTQITLVWKHDGQEVNRQTLDVGTAPHWRTWGSHPKRSAHVVDVEVLDADGHTLKTDSVSLTP